MKRLETVIGLEVHVELSTQTKIFCSCSTTFGAPPNTHTCPVCLGHPGVLPVLNEEAVNFAVRAAMALNCEIAHVSKFDRKNYFYPDSPKAYQISQFDQPIGSNGWIEIDTPEGVKRIGITRVHLEEDAGKLQHLSDGSGSLVDFNRVGVPLIEIVSEPDMRSPQEAKLYLEKLKTIIQYTGVSDVKMEEGSLRCDANISLREVGETTLGTKTEVKNLNSFRNVEKALEFERVRQEKLLVEGNRVVQQTLRWIEEENRSQPMRSKEEAHDYRYFPEPDLVRLHLHEEWREAIRSSLPALPDARMSKYINQFELSAYDANQLTASRGIADFFEETVACGSDPKQASNWITSELLGYLNKEGTQLHDLLVTPKKLAELIQLIEEGTISTKIAKGVFKEILTSGASPQSIVEQQGLVQITDEEQLRAEVKKVIEQNPESIEDLKKGKDRALGFLVGQMMKATKGKANPQLVNQLIKQEVGIE